MEYKKIPFAAGIQVLNRFNASDEAKALINDEMSVTNSIQTLSEHELNFDLIQFLAHALPVRECIWWASLCLHKRHDDWNANQGTYTHARARISLFRTRCFFFTHRTRPAA